MLTPAGALPIGFEIPPARSGRRRRSSATSRSEAIERTVKELQDLRRQAASSIVVPQGPVPGMGGAGGGGKIQIP